MVTFNKISKWYRLFIVWKVYVSFLQPYRKLHFEPSRHLTHFTWSGHNKIFMALTSIKHDIIFNRTFLALVWHQFHGCVCNEIKLQLLKVGKWIKNWKSAVLEIDSHYLTQWSSIEFCIKYNKMSIPDKDFLSLYYVSVRWKWYQMKEFRQLFCTNNLMTFNLY